jgi:hypothetical protein
MSYPIGVNPWVKRRPTIERVALPIKTYRDDTTVIILQTMLILCALLMGGIVGTLFLRGLS